MAGTPLAAPPHAAPAVSSPTVSPLPSSSLAAPVVRGNAPTVTPTISTPTATPAPVAAAVFASPQSTLHTAAYPVGKPGDGLPPAYAMAHHHHATQLPLPPPSPSLAGGGNVDGPAAAILATSRAKKRTASAAIVGEGAAAAGATATAAAVNAPGKPRKAPRVSAKDAAAVSSMNDTVKSLPNAPVVAPAAPMLSSSQYSRLDASDTAEARALGLLNATIEVSEDVASSEYGVAYEKRGGSKAAGCGTDVFPTQKALQERCKQFAMERGFQLYVAGSSSRADGGGNVKYRCKKLHGQQFFDPSTPVEQLSCPFYINGFGLGPAWKITRACFLHNHYKFIGSRLNMSSGGGAGTGATTTSSVSGGMNVDDITFAGSSEGGHEGGAGGPGGPESAKDKNAKPRPQRNTTLSTNVLCRMVNEELDKYPSSAVAMSKLDGKLIKRILLSRGHTINHMMASRIKRQIQMNRIQSIRASFQRLRSYLQLIVEKNHDTSFVFEVDERTNAFQRAMVMPAPTMHAMKYCQKVMAFDSIRASVWGNGDGESKSSHLSTSDNSGATASGSGSGNGSGNGNGNNTGIFEDESDDAVSGVYLYASTKDHNDQVLVFAVALVTVENAENWTWFLSTLRNHSQPIAAGGMSLVGSSWNEYTIFAGRMNGLQQAVHTVWPHASHHLCVRRLVEEELMFHKRLPLPKDKMQRIYDMARCESEAEYKHIRQELALTNEAVVTFLDSLNRPSWVKYAFLEAFKKPTYGVISSDLSSLDDCKLAAAMGSTSSSNLGSGMHGKPGSSSSSHPHQHQPHHMSHAMGPGGAHAASMTSAPSAVPLLKQWFGEELPRSSQPLVAFNRYFMKIAENFHSRRKSVEHRPLPELVPRRFNQLEQILQGSQRCESVPCSNGTFMVRSLAQLNSAVHDTWRHVNLLDWECTCLEWQDRLFPCVHGIHAAELNRRRIDSLYNAKVYSVEHYKTCYEVGFTPWPLESATLVVDEALTIPLEELYVQDPNVKRKPGPRPKKKLMSNKIM